MILSTTRRETGQWLGRRRPIAMGLALALGLLSSSPSRAAEEIQYNRDVRPILAANCFACHGPDSAARKAGLRLDQREAALAAKAYVPGKPEESELVRRIFSDDPKLRMPHVESRKTLKAEEKELLRRWIAAGAEYQAHWAFLAPERPPLPEVKDGAWARNPIDHFVLARLEAEGLRPAPEADRRALARRLSLDLTGLPPEPEAVEAFVNDPAPEAYGRFVDRLMDSQAWGEHRGRTWLDAARYADTHGIHFDNFREAWAYREWVIQAFNRNLSFDRFTLEQLAGDLLEKPRLDQLIASGFNRCNMTTNEGGTIPEEYLVLYTRDRIETTSQVWLGLTAGCATCHNHKFDPLTQREFYSMAAFFNNTTQNAMDGNIKDTPPTVPVPRLEDRERWEAAQAELAAANEALRERRSAARPDHVAWLEAGGAQAMAASVPSAGLVVHAPLDEGDGRPLQWLIKGQARELAQPQGAAWDEGFIAARAWKKHPGVGLEAADVADFEKDQAFSCAVWVRMPAKIPVGSVVARMMKRMATAAGTSGSRTAASRPISCTPGPTMP